MDKSTPASAANGLWARLTTVSPKQRERWAQVRVRGKRRYVWRDGVCIRGGCMFVVWSAWMVAHDYFNRHVLDHASWSPVIMGAILWPVWAYILHSSWWIENERQLLGAQVSPPPTPPSHTTVK